MATANEPKEANKTLLHAAATIASSGGTVEVLMAHTLLEARRRGQKLVAKELQALYGKLKDAKNLESLNAALSSDEACTYQLPSLVSEKLLRGELALLGGQFIERASASFPSMRIPRTLTGEAIVRLGRAFDPGLNDPLDEAVLRAALGLSGTAKTLESVLGVAPGELPTELAQIKDLFSGAPVDQADFKAAAGYLASTAKTALVTLVNQEAGKALVYADNASKLYDQLKALPDAIKPLDDYGKLRACAAVAMSALSTFGLEDAAQDVQKAMGYVETGYQVAQCVSILAAGASGWGAAFAVAGLATGAGNLSLPGLGGGHGDDDGSTAVLNALSALNKRLDYEFAKVNQKLDVIIQGMNDIWDKLLEIDGKLEFILEKVKKIDTNLDYLIQHIDLAFLELVKQAYKTEAGSYLAILNKRPNSATEDEMGKGLYFFGTTAIDFADSFLLSTRPGLLAPYPQSMAQLRDNFAPEADPVWMWSSMNLLSHELAQRGIAALPASNANWEIVAIGVDYANRVAKQHPAVFNKLTEAEKDAGMVNLGQALSRQAVFLRGLYCRKADGSLPMSVKDHPLLSKLLELYLAKIRKLLPERPPGLTDDQFVATTAYGKIVTNAATSIVDSLEKDPTAPIQIMEKGAYTPITFSVVGAPVLWTETPANTYEMFQGGNASYWTRVGNLAKVKIDAPDGPDKGASYVRFPSVELRSFKRINPIKNPFQESCNALLKLKLYDVELPSMDLLNIPFEFATQRPTTDTEVPSDPIVYIIIADGKPPDGRAGSEVFGRRVSEKLIELKATIHDQQVQRVWYNHRLHSGYIAARMALPGSTERSVYDATLQEMSELAVLMRAILKLGYGDLYAAMDPLNALFDGDLETRLVDPLFLDKWAVALSKGAVLNAWPVDDPARPGVLPSEVEMAYDTSDRVNKLPRAALRTLEQIALERYERLEKALNVMLESASNGGHPAQFEVLKRSFANVHPDYD